MAIPVGNDFVERIFSGLKRVWTDERNRMNISLIKAEICIKNNISLSCIDFKNLIKEKENFIKAVKTYQKYKFVKQ